jgi:hypothetical protein
MKECQTENTESKCNSQPFHSWCEDNTLGLTNCKRKILERKKSAAIMRSTQTLGQTAQDWSRFC